MKRWGGVGCISRHGLLSMCIKIVGWLLGFRWRRCIVVVLGTFLFALASKTARMICGRRCSIRRRRTAQLWVHESIWSFSWRRNERHGRRDIIRWPDPSIGILVHFRLSGLLELLLLFTTSQPEEECDEDCQSTDTSYDGAYNDPGIRLVRRLDGVCVRTCSTDQSLRCYPNGNAHRPRLW